MAQLTLAPKQETPEGAPAGPFAAIWGSYFVAPPPGAPAQQNNTAAPLPFVPLVPAMVPVPASVAQPQNPKRKRPRGSGTFGDDAALGTPPIPTPMALETATAAAAAAAGVGPQYAAGDEENLTPEQRRERRKVRNRESARLHRERQKEHVDKLEALLKERDAELAVLRQATAVRQQAEEAERELRRELEQLRAQNETLLKRVAELEAAGAAFDNVVAEIEEIPASAVTPLAKEMGFLAPMLPSGSDTEGGTTPAASSGTDDSGESSGDSDHELGETEDDGLAASTSVPALRGPIARARSMGLGEADFFSQLDSMELDLDATLEGEEGLMDLAELPCSPRAVAEAQPAAAAAAATAGDAAGAAAGGPRARNTGVALFSFGLLFMLGLFGKSPLQQASAPPQLSRHFSAGGVQRDAAAPNGGGRVLLTEEKEQQRQQQEASSFQSVNASAHLWSQDPWRRNVASRERRGSVGPHDWVLSPLEAQPHRWRGVAATGVGQPWRYRRAAELYGPEAWRMGGPAPLECCNSTAAADDAAPAALRGRIVTVGKEQKVVVTTPAYDDSSSSSSSGGASANAGAVGSEAASGGLVAKEVDLYRQLARAVEVFGGGQASGAASSCDKDGWVRGPAADYGGGAGNGSEEPLRPAGKSYMFCPKAYGVMSPSLVPRPAGAAGNGSGGAAGGQAGSGGGAAAAAAAGGGPAAPLVARVVTTVPGDAAAPASAARALVAAGLGGSAMYASAGAGGAHGEAGNGAEGEYLLLLVPSGSVDWGEKSGDMPRAFNASGGGGEEGAGRQGWLEIGCRVLNARLVHDVHFTL